VTCDDATYGGAWDAVRARMLALGHRAWLFRAPTDAARYIEFLEWKQPDNADDPRTDGALRTALLRLDECGQGNSELWIEP
jgi:hypothetical protein